MRLKVNSIVERGSPESLPISNFQFSIEPLLVLIRCRAHALFGNWKLEIGNDSMSTFFGHELLIIRGREQRVQFSGIFQRDLHHPGTVRVFINILGRGGKILVCLRYRAGRGRVQIRHCFHGFNGTKRLTRRDFCAYFGQLDEDDIAQLFLRVIGDSDRTRASIHLNPFVLFRVFAI